MSGVAHAVRLFAGPADVLERFHAVATGAAIVWLTPGAEIAALALTDAVHDALHRANGTGAWADQGPRLSSSDMAFAQRLSERGPLAYLETDYAGGAGYQSAMLWIGGGVALGPMTMTVEQGRSRAARLWPINAALRGLGVRADEGGDEFSRFGLVRYGSNDAIVAHGRPIARR